MVAFAVFHHFARRQRWLPALQFFSRLAQHHAAAAVYIAAALRELGDVDQAFSTLTGAMERDPFSAQLLVATSSEFLYAEQVGCGGWGCCRCARVFQLCRLCRAGAAADVHVCSSYAGCAGIGPVHAELRARQSCCLRLLLRLGLHASLQSPMC